MLVKKGACPIDEKQIIAIRNVCHYQVTLKRCIEKCAYASICGEPI